MESLSVNFHNYRYATSQQNLLRLQRVQIVASTGRLEIPAPFDPDPIQASSTILIVSQ
jgi:hypothetical protein